MWEAVNGLLCVLFTPLVWQLGSPSFEERERAERLLAASIPLSLPAVTHGMQHSSPEVAARSRRVWVRFPLERENLLPTLIAYHLIYSEFPETDGLPYPPAGTSRRFGSDVAVRRAIVRLAHRDPHWIPHRGTTIALDPDDPWCQKNQYAKSRDLEGLSNIRFIVRGIHPTSEVECARLWLPSTRHKCYTWAGTEVRETHYPHLEAMAERWQQRKKEGWP